MAFYKKIIAALFIGCIFLLGCRDIYELEKYQRPDWLAGKIFTQITTRPDLSVFQECLVETGYDTILEATGFYTVLGPTNQAFEEWFGLHPEYGGTVQGIPPKVLENLVERHILQNGWSKKQMQSLDIYGWIDRDDPFNDKPRGYKRQTIQKDANKKYYLAANGRIVDSTEAVDYKKVYFETRKYAPIFFDEYFGVNNLQTSDYNFYFDREFESGNVYVGNAKIVSPEIFAENGFVYEIDQVTDPLHNAEQILDQDYTNHSFSEFREVFNLFADFRVNMDATNLQPEAKAGGLYDTLYNLNYPGLEFNIHEELTGPSTSFTNYAVRYQNGILAPTNQAFEDLLNNYVTANSGYPHWKDFNSVPLEVKSIILNAHLTDYPVYLTNMKNGFVNGNEDKISLDESDVAFTYYGSNCSFVGLNEAIVPRAFLSITGPIYLRPGYSTLLYAMEYSKTLPALKQEGKEYVFYAQSDDEFVVDSALILDWIDPSTNRYRFRALDQSSERIVNISRNQLTKMILNQVGVSLPRGVARKEFIENLAGNYIVVNNVDNTVSGGLPNTFGYNGDSVVDVQPKELIEETDNGKTYEVRGWINTPVTVINAVISSYPYFFNLIDRAGLYDDVFYTFPFLTEGENYTIFIPTEDALSKYNTDSLNTEELQSFLKYHFIRGEKLWTDGSTPSGYFETLRVDELSTQFSRKYSSLNIETDIDKIRILDKDGNLYTEIEEEVGSTNIMIATDMDASSTSIYDFII
ncbi:fasciclin domain-containing protein, partial [Bacteroidota bacterium]